jgi:hypothetical protein
MWLPKYEIRLLQGYYLILQQPGKILHIDKINDWAPINESLHVKQFVDQFQHSHSKLGRQLSLATSSNANNNEIIKEMIKGQKYFSEINLVNKALKDRGLIDSTDNIDATSSPRSISLTTNGCDLGRKYNFWWTRSKLWYDKYIKGHWIWLFICFIMGGIITQLISWLSSFLGAK